MIGLDTNVLVRYFAQDDEAQAHEAERVIDTLTDDDPGFVSLVVLCELIWVLGHAYRVPADEILVIVEGMLSTRELRIQEADSVHRAVRSSRTAPAEMVDALVGELGAAAGCTETVTFDRAAAELATMRLLTTRRG
ncbi:PIN domain-containing protein [Aeromicrobium sp. CTD01-1L150]|uniref:PIN domain-containing protein n=1 Tax=Aeromicrobium sp. CTD01-1L150 TaxID=3341830 RepID=UPI0035BF3A4C